MFIGMFDISCNVVSVRFKQVIVRSKNALKFDLFLEALVSYHSPKICSHVNWPIGIALKLNVGRGMFV